jgi:hypothetical protein
MTGSVIKTTPEGVPRVERTAQKFYDGLEEGIIWGTHCNDCEEYSFPPFTACRNCGSRDIEFSEMSGHGTLEYYSSTMLPSYRFRNEDRMAYGMVRLEEGPYFFTKIEGVDFSSPEAIEEGNKALPADVVGKPEEVAGATILVFEMEE